MWRERVFSNMRKCEFCTQILYLLRERERDGTEKAGEIKRGKTVCRHELSRR